jgi:glutathione S-transferase
MIDVYAFATPNSVKVPIALEEMELEYTLHSINIRQGGQKQPDFVALNRNAKVPVLVDHGAEGAGFVLSESAAILVYLAEKTGKLLPAAGADRARVFEQLFFHASSLGVAFGNAGYFSNEADRVVGVLDAVLAQHRYVAGDTLSIADTAHFGWMWRREFAGVSLDTAPYVQRWLDELLARPAFARGIERTLSLAPTA